VKTATDAIVRSARLDLPLLEPDLLDALIGDQRAAIDAITGYHVPASFPDAEQREFLRFRRGQLTADPARYPWSLRAIVLRSERRMVGYVHPA